VSTAAVGSFRVKLVVYFLALALLPLGAIFWALGSVVSQNETHRVDARLQAGLRAALAAYEDRVGAAQRSADTLARSRAFQVALERRDAPRLRALLHGRPLIQVVAPGVHIGRAPDLATTRRAAVVTRSRLAGTVIASVPFDDALAGALRSRSGLTSSEAVAILRAGRIVAASPPHSGRLSLGPGRMATVRIGSARYRVLVAAAVGDTPRVSFAVLSPQSAIDAANASTRDRLLLVLLVTLVIVALVAYVEGRTIVRTLRGLVQAAQGIASGRLTERVPVRGRDEFAQLGAAFNTMASQLEARVAELEAERGRLRDAITRFGEALGATHDPAQLLRVIVEASVEATGAHGATLTADDGTVVEAGDTAAAADRLELPLTAGTESFGTLVLVGSEFDTEQRMTAASLASHAAIALENARLHRVVERQALVDELTGIANRRSCEEALATEIARADRLGTPLTLILADLDDFKAVNDEHGHPVGDEVLRRFTRVLKQTIRESDTAGRWGGEEFLLLLPGSDGAGGSHLAERMRESLGRSGPPSVTCSFGVAQHAAGEGPEQLFAAADRALYRAKRRGKNRVELDAAVRSF
jgi:diguanylate cyclase (GGDEF)-like protein